MNNIFDKSSDDLFKAISMINDKKECEDFFIDLCTIKEIKEMSKRYKAANMLYQGYNFVEIIKETGISSATLARVNKSLQYGSGGYLKQIKKTKRGKEYEN